MSIADTPEKMSRAAGYDIKIVETDKPSESEARKAIEDIKVSPDRIPKTMGVKKVRFLGF